MLRIGWLLVAVTLACAADPSREQRPFRDAPGLAPGNPGFDPTTDAHNPNIDGPRPNEPVFVIPWKRYASDEEQEREAERQRYIMQYRTFWMSDPSRYPEHHIFPRQWRKDFERSGIDVDLYTILVDPAKHQKAHSGQEIYGPGGKWNWEWRQWLNAHPTPDPLSLWKNAFAMIDRHGLGPHGPLCPYHCGREVVHDQFDVETPAPAPGK